MADIVDNEEIDRDTVDGDVIDEQFSKVYKLLTESAVSQKKSYVNKLHGTKSLKLAVSLTDNSIEVYQLNNTSLSQVCRLSGHQKALTEVVCCPTDDSLVYSAGQDGLVKLWDTRRGGLCVQEYKDDKEELIRPYECMDVSCNGKVLCAGSQLVEDDAYLVFWDQRQPKPLGGYWNSHTDEITQVKFHKDKTGILASGSLDGLVNVYNAMEQSEDDALTYSFNVENSIDTLTWLDDRQLACITQSNDFQLYDADTGDLIKSHDRDKIARSIKRSRGDDCYVVNTFMSTDDTIILLAGSNAGDGEVLRSVTVTQKKLQPCTNFKGNNQIVRCCWYDKDKDILVTAGEAGILSVWAAGPGAAGPEAGGGGPKQAHTVRRLHDNRHKPY